MHHQNDTKIHSYFGTVPIYVREREGRQEFAFSSDAHFWFSSIKLIKQFLLIF